MGLVRESGPSSKVRALGALDTELDTDMVLDDECRLAKTDSKSGAGKEAHKSALQVAAAILGGTGRFATDSSSRAEVHGLLSSSSNEEAKQPSVTRHTADDLI